jgi:hypothetical protein
MLGHTFDFVLGKKHLAWFYLEVLTEGQQLGVDVVACYEEASVHFIGRPISK